jgi:hypothetical protein
MPHWKIIKNMEMIASEVMPRVRGKVPAPMAIAAE